MISNSGNAIFKFGYNTFNANATALHIDITGGSGTRTYAGDKNNWRSTATPRVGTGITITGANFNSSLTASPVCGIYSVTVDDYSSTISEASGKNPSAMSVVQGVDLTQQSDSIAFIQLLNDELDIENRVSAADNMLSYTRTIINDSVRDSRLVRLISLYDSLSNISSFSVRKNLLYNFSGICREMRQDFDGAAEHFQHCDYCLTKNESLSSSWNVLFDQSNKLLRTSSKAYDSALAVYMFRVTKDLADLQNKDTKFASQLESKLLLNIINNVGAHVSKSSPLINLDFTLLYPSEIKVELYDILGKQLYSSKGYNEEIGQHTIEIPMIAGLSGTYFIRVSTKNGEVHTAKLNIIR